MQILADARQDSDMIYGEVKGETLIIRDGRTGLEIWRGFDNDLFNERFYFERERYAARAVLAALGLTVKE